MAACGAVTGVLVVTKAEAEDLAPDSGTLKREVRCLHLPFPVPAGTLIEQISVERVQGDVVVCKGRAYLPHSTLVAFPLDALEGF